MLARAEVAAFYRRYLSTVAALAGEEAARGLAPWLLPLRRLLVLRAVTWCAKWLVQQGKSTGAGTENWSAAASDPALVAHVAERVADYLSPATLARMAEDCAGDSPLRRCSRSRASESLESRFLCS